MHPEIRDIYQRGVPVHWIEVGSFAHFLVHLTASDLKGEIRAKPHLVEDAMSFYSLLCETKSAESAGKAYTEHLRGNFAERRYKDLNFMLGAYRSFRKQ